MMAFDGTGGSFVGIVGYAGFEEGGIK